MPKSMFETIFAKLTSKRIFIYSEGAAKKQRISPWLRVIAVILVLEDRKLFNILDNPRKIVSDAY